MAELEKERQMKQSGQVTSSTDPNVNHFKGADLMLTGKLASLNHQDHRRHQRLCALYFHTD